MISAPSSSATLFSTHLGCDRQDDDEEVGMRIDVALIGRCEAQRRRIAAYASSRPTTSAPGNEQGAGRVNGRLPSPALRGIYVRQRETLHRLKQPAAKRVASVSKRSDCFKIRIADALHISVETRLLHFPRLQIPEPHARECNIWSDVDDKHWSELEPTPTKTDDDAIIEEAKNTKMSRFKNYFKSRFGT